MLNIEALCTSSDEDEVEPSSSHHTHLHAQVSVAEDTSSIWLTNIEAGDVDFVSYLSDHPLLRRTTDVVGYCSWVTVAGLLWSMGYGR